MASVKGFVEKIKYRNEENGYTVLSLTGRNISWLGIFLSLERESFWRRPAI